MSLAKGIANALGAEISIVLLILIVCKACGCEPLPPRTACIVRSINLPRPAAIQPVKGVVRPALAVVGSKPLVFGKVRAAITK